MKDWTLHIEALEAENEALTADYQKLIEAVYAHTRVCRGWFGDDPIWEQIIANQEWAGRREK